jgi:hypothetical protein
MAPKKQSLTSKFSVELPGIEPAALPGRTHPDLALHYVSFPIQSLSLPAVSFSGLDGVKDGQAPPTTELLNNLVGREVPAAYPAVGSAFYNHLFDAFRQGLAVVL